MIKILLPLLFLTSGTAIAQEPDSSAEAVQSEESKPTPTTDWARVDERMNTTFKASSNVLWAGLVASLFGSAINHRLVEDLGSLATTGGAITRTAASLRQRRSIEERGATVSGTWGYTSWTLMGVGAGLSVTSAAYASGLEMDKDGNPPPEAIGPLVGFGLGMVVANVGVLVAASKQMKVNGKRRMDIGKANHGPTHRSMQVQWAPTVDHTGRLGLTLSAAF